MKKLIVFLLMVLTFWSAILVQKSGIAQGVYAASTKLYVADFSKLWRTGTVLSDLGEGSRIYYESGISGGYGVIEAYGSNQTKDASIYLPYMLPTQGSYTVQFDVQLDEGYTYDAVIRLNLNQQLPNGSYTITINPLTQDWEIRKYVNSSPTILASGHSTSINNDNGLNRMKVYRNNSNGELKFSVNNTQLTQVYDTTYLGGQNRVSLVSRNARLRVSNFSVFK